jgi:flagellar basal-body rod modification protein FlgD
MEISTLAASNTGMSGTAGGRGMSGLSGDDFMMILLKQLQLQDPMQPMSNQEMVSQMSTIRELELNTRLSRKLEQLTDQQRYGSAAALLGKYVTGTLSDDNGNLFPMEGVVMGIRFTPTGEAMLELDTGQQLPLSKLESVTDAGAAAGDWGQQSPIITV